MLDLTAHEDAPECGIWQVDSATYHADRSAVSHSGLEVLHRSPAEYAAKYVTGTLPFPEPTREIVLGSVVHALLLQQDRFAILHALAPDVDRRYKEGKKEYDAFKEGVNGRVV